MCISYHVRPGFRVAMLMVMLFPHDDDEGEMRLRMMMTSRRDDDALMQFDIKGDLCREAISG